MEPTLLVRKVYLQIRDLLNGLPDGMVFHNFQHTLDVFLVSTEMGIASNLSATELHALQLASLFHDCGYWYEYQGHEEKSKLIAANYLVQENCSDWLVGAVMQAIEATKVPQQPKNELERILCDADLFHLSQPDYQVFAGHLRNEWQVMLNKVFQDEEWLNNSLQFMEQHEYQSAYANINFTPGKLHNIALLRAQLNIS